MFRRGLRAKPATRVKEGKIEPNHGVVTEDECIFLIILSTYFGDFRSGEPLGFTFLIFPTLQLIDYK